MHRLYADSMPLKTFLDFGTHKMERLGVFSTHLRDTVGIYVFK